MQLLVQANSSWRWLVSTRPWIIQIRSWGTITTWSLCDFAQQSATGRHKLWKQCWKGHWLCKPPTRHAHLCSHKFGQQNHTTVSLVRPSNNILVITSQKHWYEGSGLVCHPNMMPLHTHTTRHMNFRAPTRNTWQSTDRITYLFSTLSLHVIPRHSPCNSWPSCALYDHSCSFPRTPPDISHCGRCVQGIQKNLVVREWSTDLLSFYNTQ